jgi:hypothetical protein
LVIPRFSISDAKVFVSVEGENNDPLSSFLDKTFIEHEVRRVNRKKPMTSVYCLFLRSLTIYDLIPLLMLDIPPDLNVSSDPASSGPDGGFSEDFFSFKRPSTVSLSRQLPSPELPSIKKFLTKPPAISIATVNAFKGRRASRFT